MRLDGYWYKTISNIIIPIQLGTSMLSYLVMEYLHNENVKIEYKNWLESVLSTEINNENPFISIEITDILGYGWAELTAHNVT